MLADVSGGLVHALFTKIYAALGMFLSLLPSPPLLQPEPLQTLITIPRLFTSSDAATAAVILALARRLAFQH